ncbi:glycosyltransferase [Paenibacillus sp. P96]|uniref:Glycosyltransferase n=1 Tax=Paenibacillus zeirhizosphaerae TaxID=2987519 RepID=A0ABT9FTI5_9BACL|nr:glycosyltransferase family 2 protein [Paenibacillus sp. P96]MDP4098023.1 glycosyltransferase [Paenibacillus sp. P96]
MSDVSIIICTRNRIEDLTRCIQSIAGQQDIKHTAIELLIVDDGDIPVHKLEEYREMISKLPDGELKYYKKEQPGVWLSRYQALSMVKNEIVIYFDDDAELDDRLYLRRLLDTYKQDESIVGVGGVAKGLSTSRAGKLLGVLTCQMSSSPGKLSPSGLAGSLLQWGEAKSVFPTEFFHGCNMSFRRFALNEMKPYPWMTSYAVADDLYMCYLASRYGKLVIDPNLRIIHHESPSSRDKAGKVAKATAVNHYYFLLLKQAGMWNYIALLWTLFYSMIKHALKRNFNAVSGYAQGILFVLNPRKQKYHEYTASLPIGGKGLT